MARTATTTSSLPRPVLLTSVGLLAKHIPLSTVTAVLGEHGKASQRDRLLPAPFLVYVIVALSLYMPNALREVLRCVVEGLRTLGFRRGVALAVATKGAISRARTRLGWEVLATLYARVAGPLATRETRGAWYQQWRLVALDGTSLALPATAENDAAFGTHASKAGDGAFPLLTLVALVEVGTHAVLRMAFDACAVAEIVLAARLLPAMTAGMLVLEDRGFVGYDWWRQVRDTGAEVLCRLRTNMHFPVHQRLPDGSYLSVLAPPRGGPGVSCVVRVIVYTLHGVPGADPVYRLVTSVLDPDAAPARELAALYHERWEAECAFDEFKTHVRGGAHVLLRSKTPALVRQEVYGLLLAHYVVRAVMHDAARQVDEDPDRLSFLHTVRVLRRKLPQAATFSPSATDALVPVSAG
jgi:hypothetical protein